MCVDSDEEISDLEIESRTWNKLHNNMKQIGFREGAAKGRDLSLQQGFNLGYADGFEVGEHLGILKGVLSLQKELGITTQNSKVSDEDLKNVLCKACVMCQMNERSDGPSQENNTCEKLEFLIERQKCQNSEIEKNFNFNIEKR